MNQNEAIFEQARLIYPGRKRGFQVEWDYFRKAVKDWKSVLPLLMEAIQKQKAERVLLAQSKQFVPCWKDFKSWILNRYWELSTPELDKQRRKKKSEKEEYWKEAEKELETYRAYIEENIHDPEKLKGVPRRALVLYNREKERENNHDRT